MVPIILVRSQATLKVTTKRCLNSAQGCTLQTRGHQLVSEAMHYSRASFTSRHQASVLWCVCRVPAGYCHSTHCNRFLGRALSHKRCLLSRFEHHTLTHAVSNRSLAVLTTPFTQLLSLQRACVVACDIRAHAWQMLVARKKQLQKHQQRQLCRNTPERYPSCTLAVK